MVDNLKAVALSYLLLANFTFVWHGKTNEISYVYGDYFAHCTMKPWKFSDLDVSQIRDLR